MAKPSTRVRLRVSPGARRTEGAGRYGDGWEGGGTASRGVRLRVSRGARRPEVAGRYGDGWKVRVSAPPERGRANEAVLDLLADTLELPRRRRSPVSGTAP